MLLYHFQQSECFGSHTDLLALVLHTAPYCPPGYNKSKCLKSPEWKWGLFFFFRRKKKSRDHSRPHLVYWKHQNPVLDELMKNPSSREVNHCYPITGLSTGMRNPTEISVSMWVCVVYLLTLYHFDCDMPSNSRLKRQTKMLYTRPF